MANNVGYLSEPLLPLPELLPLAPPDDEINLVSTGLPLLDASVRTIYRQIKQGRGIAVAFSAGKDSSCVMLAALEAARQATLNGLPVTFLALNANTGVENPENVNYAETELAKAKAFGEQHNFKVQAHISMPSLASSWALRIIGGRALPSFPGTNHDCSQEWKIIPMTRLRKRVLNGHEIEIVTLTGTRYDESVVRAANMTKRGESDIDPITNDKGDLVLSPICYWDVDDVWEAIGTAASGAIPSYSNFEDTMRLYADAGGSSCAVVSDAIMSAKPKGGCGSRFGCWSCVAVGKDESLENMLEGNEPLYGYMSGLNKLRDFIANTRWDLSRRLWVGRTINDDKITISPDVYSPNMMLEILRYALTLDVQEKQQAQRERRRQKFQIISLQELVGIDAMWSLQGYHRPHQAIKEYNDIYNNGVVYEIPTVPVTARPDKLPRKRYFPVTDWDEGLRLFASGLRNTVLEMVADADTSNCMGTRELPNGKVVLDVNTDVEFSVDGEGAEMAMMFEMDTMMDLHARSDGKNGLTAAYRFWVSYGAVSLAKNQSSIHDDILRRTCFKERQGLAGPDVDITKLLARCDAMPINAKVKETSMTIAANVRVEYTQSDLFADLDTDDETEDAMAPCM